MRAAFLFSLMVCQACIAGLANEPKAAGDWSQATNGLRGRLIFAEEPKSERGMRRGFVYLELQNAALGETMHVYYDAAKEPLHCELCDSEGKPVRNWISASDWVPNPCWLALPLDSTLRFRTGNASIEPDEPGLFVISAFMGGRWFIPASATNDYYLSGTFRVKVPAGETRPRMWEGTLNLPKLKVPAKNP